MLIKASIIKVESPHPQLQWRDWEYVTITEKYCKMSTCTN